MNTIIAIFYFVLALTTLAICCESNILYEVLQTSSHFNDRRNFLTNLLEESFVKRDHCRPDGHKCKKYSNCCSKNCNNGVCVTPLMSTKLSFPLINGTDSNHTSVIAINDSFAVPDLPLISGTNVILNHCRSEGHKCRKNSKCCSGQCNNRVCQAPLIVIDDSFAVVGPGDMLN